MGKSKSTRKLKTTLNIHKITSESSSQKQILQHKILIRKQKFSNKLFKLPPKEAVKRIKQSIEI